MTPTTADARPRNLASRLVDELAQRLREGQWRPGDRLPPESALVQAYGVSRTVVREALSRLQAAGLVQTRHGVGTFAAEPPEAPPRLRVPTPEEAATLVEVVAVLELRLALEGEAAAMAAVRRDAGELAAMRGAQRDFADAIDSGGDNIAADRQLHQQIARATHNPHFVALMGHLAEGLIPRTRVDTAAMSGDGRRNYLWRVHAEHESIVNAIDRGDPEAARAAMRTHLSNSRDRLQQAQRLADAAAAAAATRGA